MVGMLKYELTPLFKSLALISGICFFLFLITEKTPRANGARFETWWMMGPPLYPSPLKIGSIYLTLQHLMNM